MEVRPKAVICPVCLLFLREGISLRSHLQTHSKEKVIEALLYKQSEPASIEKETLTSAIRNASKISNLGNKVAQYNRGTVSILPSTSYTSANNLNQTICNPTISTVNNIQYVPTINNNVFPQAVGNSYSNVTYQQFLTNEGNIVLIPVYMPQPSVVVGNMVPPSFINSCVVVPPANNTNPVNIVEQRSRKPENVETSTEVPITEENSHSTGKNDKPMEEDDEKENDAEVASIFKISNSNDNENSSSPQSPEKMNLEDGKLSSMSYENLDISDHENYSESSPSEFQNESDMQKSAISPGLSSIRVRSDLNYESDCSFHDDVNTSRANSVKCDESEHNKPSKLEDFGECSNNTLRNVTADKSERFDFIVSNSDNATHILPDNLEEYQNSKVEKDHYILPNDIPRNSPCSDLNFIGIRSSFLTSASLISSANKTMFADMDMYEVGNDDQNYFNKFNNQSADGVEKDDTTIIPKRYINDVEDKRKDIIESAGNSRISPFNIQTDESMPARGELSGQESLSGTENSIWELQVQQNTCVQRCNISCKKESSDVKVGLQSLMTEISIKLDTETFKQADDEEDVVEEDNKVVMEKLFKKKVIREYRCFYCKERFTTWKLRQIHINNVHSDEDGLTVETLFSKKIKFKQEDDTDPTPVENVICRICSVTFENSLEFLKHLKNMHGIKKRSCVCPTCLVHFPSVQEYEEHIQNVHPYECMNCGKKFHTRSGYMLHQKRHMKVKPYGCEVCDKSFVTKQKLSEHMNIHTGDNPIKCNLCNSNFKRYSNYQQHKKYLHMNTKRKLKDFICDCGEVFHSKVKLLWHQEIHDEKPKQCPFCVERFVHTASLTRHVRKWHNETYMSELVDKKKIRNVTCPVCNVTYLHTSLQTHMKIHEGIKPFSCSECSKTFRTKWNLQLHRWTHMSRSSKPFKCKICVKAYIHKTDYEAHLRSHSNCRPYSCNVCGRQFIRKYNCIRHMREHKEPRMFKCNICDKMFSRSYYLTEHRKTHTGEKPHTCHICGKSSATKSNHNKHVKMHNNIRESVNSEG